ncbi:UNVERIFIED_CONTAM: hypothetical protein FKN15_040390 [Acipenser sinensis]
MFSAECKAESRTVFRISTCGHCGYRYEDFAPGYDGNGKRVILQGFCGDVEHSGFCSMECAER